MQLPPIRLERLLEALNVPGLRYVLVGGLAAVLRGALQATTDADLAILYNSENRKLLADALEPLHPRPLRGAGGAWVWDEKCIFGPWCSYLTDAGRVDLLIRIPGVESFDALYLRSEIIDLDGLPARVASLDDLISMKQTSGRPKDLLHLMELEEIKRLEAGSD
ncbi:MAG TPA: hypothetical protein VK934_11675 [Fimbriimonas sp.]|nr:hypothetical protein [Fimbriimonas sp.]